MDIKNLPRFDNHSHSEFSNLRLIDSINRAEDMILTAHKLGMKGIALTDHETVSGHVKWLNTEKELKKAGKIPEDFKCACGNEIYLVDDRNNIQRYWHFILAAKNTEGHRALRELSSIAWYNGFSSKGLMRVPTQKDELAEIVKKYPNTLIATSACFRKGTLVKTKNGDKKIEDITNNDCILNMYGEWEKVNFPTSRIFNGDGRVITFLENDTPTICTDNHQFLVTTNNKIQKYKSTGKIPYEWVEAKKLITKKGSTKHILLYPIEKIQYNNRNIIRKSEWKNCLRDDNYFVNKKSLITNEDILNYMSVAIQHDKKKYIDINGILYKKVYIKNIEEIKMNEEVHCLNVDSHSFCCNGIIVHNCLGGELPHLVAKLVDAEKKNLSEEEILNIKLEIVAFLRYCVDLFGDDFYIEIAAADSKDQKVFNQRIKSIAESQGIKIVIGSDAHYLTANERELHKAYLNSKEGEREIDNFYYFAHMMDNEEAYGYISDIYSEEDFKEFCENSMEIYNKIEGYDIFRNPIIPEVKVIPKECPVSLELVEKYTYPVLYNLVISNNIQEKYWVSECLNALANKNLWNGKYLERLEIEAKVIKTIGEKLGDCLFKYFNTFQHFIDLFWECGSIVGPGRGSAVCFLSNYLLGITQLDPVVWNLNYWRFLNEERIELPKLNIGQYKIGEHIQWCA